MCSYEILCNTRNLTREEWLSFRRYGIGGSDASVVAGCNPYRSIFELWKDKRGEMPIAEEDSEVTHFGTILEEVVRKEFVTRTGIKVRKKNAILRSKKYPYMLADLDGVVSESDGTYSIFEAKTATEFKNTDWKDGKIPAPYQMQLQHYFTVTGFSKAYIAALVGGNKFYWYEIYRDEQLIKMLISMEAHFWQCVQSGEKPSTDGSKATELYLGQEYAKLKKGSVIHLEEGMARKITEYESLKEQMEILSEEKRKIENQFKEMLGENETARVGEHFVKWKAVEQTRIDAEKLKKEYSNAYNACVKKVSYRRFSVA